METNEITALQTGHIGLIVSDLDRSTKFYEGVFGFRKMGESRAAERLFVFLGDGQKVIVTLWQQATGGFDRTLPGLHHLSFQVGSMEEVKRLEKKLRDMNTHFHHEGIVAHGEGAKSGGVFFEDPDGIRLEIYSPEGAQEHAAPGPGAPACGFF